MIREITVILNELVRFCYLRWDRLSSQREVKKYAIFAKRNIKSFIFINTADRVDDIQLDDDDGEATNDEKVFLNEQDTEFWDEGK